METRLTPRLKFKYRRVDSTVQRKHFVLQRSYVRSSMSSACTCKPELSSGHCFTNINPIQHMARIPGCGRTWDHFDGSWFPSKTCTFSRGLCDKRVCLTPHELVSQKQRIESGVGCNTCCLEAGSDMGPFEEYKRFSWKFCQSHFLHWIRTQTKGTQNIRRWKSYFSVFRCQTWK